MEKKSIHKIFHKKVEKKWNTCYINIRKVMEESMKKKKVVVNGKEKEIVIKLDSELIERNIVG